MLQASFVIWTYGEKSMKVVAVTTVTGPYIIARYRCFAEMYPQHELTLLELGENPEIMRGHLRVLMFPISGRFFQISQ